LCLNLKLNKNLNSVKSISYFQPKPEDLSQEYERICNFLTYGWIKKNSESQQKNSIISSKQNESGETTKSRFEMNVGSFLGFLRLD